MKDGIQELDDLIGELVTQRDALRAMEAGALELAESERGSHRAKVQAGVQEVGQRLASWDATRVEAGDPLPPDQQGLTEDERAANEHAREQKRKRQEERHG